MGTTQEKPDFLSRIWRLCTPCHKPRANDPAAAAAAAVSAASRQPTAVHVLLLSLLLLIGAFVSFQWIDKSALLPYAASRKSTAAEQWTQATCRRPDLPDPPSCPSPSPPVSRPTPGVISAGEARPPAVLCPAYFRWIHEDLGPWAVNGITREMVERAKEKATFRLVVLGGRAYVQRYGRRTFQTRDLFTQWGILQLLRLYPGKVPDLELMFDCADDPAVPRAAYSGDTEETTAPPLFGYCRDGSTVDIVFPDWSFWGWPEINIKPWGPLMQELKEANGRLKWADREPYAFWKGNPATSGTRRLDLLRCNVSAEHDWNARLYALDWGEEIKRKFKTSDLADQCRHRYLIYIEGNTWSVSEKYILACDSPALLVTPRYHAFFSRGLVPLRHYWPVSDDRKCPSIKFAVDWGNSHPREAQEIGKRGSGFIGEEVNMDSVYDYMFHLLKEYAALQRFEPTRPPDAVELCPEVMACPAGELEKEFMVQSMVKAPRPDGPCALPPPFSAAEVRLWMAERANSTAKVERWETEARHVR